MKIIIMNVKNNTRYFGKVGKVYKVQAVSKNDAEIIER
ncbi:hypothetical protein phiCT9441A_24 (endogenous virus) [Clostridium phage phiCT9441A]|nr:hypothetical protein phiCT9441A_24 [Clostridium phage phiCT9441A]AJA42636.1 hypothetical protein phiCT9441A_24 [Clostridium phage phiCT9441A]